MNASKFYNVSALPSVVEPEAFYLLGRTLYFINPDETIVTIGVISNSSGQVALVAGTKAITIAGLSTTSVAFLQLVSPSGASSTIQYKAVCTANTLTITALIAAGTINASDVSTVNYVIFD